MPNTPKMNFPYPEYKKKPYYNKIVEFFNAVDAAVFALSEGGNHETLAGLLGGATADHWHLTQAQHDDLLSEGPASREDRNVFVFGGGNFTFDSISGQLSWDNDLIIVSLLAYAATVIPAGSVVIPAGQVAYVKLTRPVSDMVATIQIGTIGTNDVDYGICVRPENDLIIFRTGVTLSGGGSVRPFEPSGRVIPDGNENGDVLTWIDPSTDGSWEMVADTWIDI